MISRRVPVWALAGIAVVAGLCPAIAGATPPAADGPGGKSPAPRSALAQRPPTAADSLASVNGGATPNTTLPSDPAGDPAATASSGADPLSENGFGSVLCRDRRLEAGLSNAAQSNCSTSNFVAAAAPTGNYGFDVHIDTGLLPSTSTLWTIVQDLVLTPVWTALVWITHALLVALEWCYSLDLLNATMASVTNALHGAQQTVTQPWLAAVLAAASALALYNGLIRRRVAETLGDFLLMLAMMAVGLWVIVDPVGTVGSLGRWANSASLGAAGAVESGSPGQAESRLGDGLRNVFATAIGGPWCFLEFGDVDWCREPSRLDPRLRTAAEQIARTERASSAPPGRDSATLLGEAHSNGDLFLALPANGPQRNSINDPRSLLHVLCQSADANNCRGPTAAQAQFRTAGATWSRAGGLLLIVIGFLGMVCVLSFIALRLLGAAVMSLLYLLMAPVAVLAPALGDGGRMAFRAWGRRLLGALVAKLIYSVLLGVVLLMLRLLEGLNGLGWWTQWLLVACLWWIAFTHRHQVLGLLGGQPSERRPRSSRAAALLYGRELGRVVARVRNRTPDAEGSSARPSLNDPSPSQAEKVRDDISTAGPEGLRSDPKTAVPSEPGRTAPAGAEIGGTLLGEQVDRLMAVPPPDEQDALARRQRLEQESARARDAGDTLRARRLEARWQRVAEDIAPLGHSAGSQTAASDARAWLDRQAYLPGGRERTAAGAERRNYALLAGLIGLTPSRYRAAGGGEQLRARLAIDRELDRRRQVLSDQTLPTVGATVSQSRAPSREAETPQVHGPERPDGRTQTRVPAAESTVMRRERQLMSQHAGAAQQASSDRRPSPRVDGDV